MSLSLSNSLPFAWISLVKLGKNSKISFFSEFEPIFLLFGGVCSKRDFCKKKFFLREGFFETNLDLNKHPQQVFWFFWAFFSNFFSKKNNHYILEELRQLCSKFHNFSMKIRGETRVQSWTFLALFFRKRIVQCDYASSYASDLRTHLKTHSALCVFGKRGQKMFNFELLFLHKFSSNSSRI